MRTAILSILITASLPLAALRATDLAPGRAIVVSEISYNPPASLGSDDRFEFVEVHNRSEDPVDVSGWRLKDRDDLHDFTIPPGTTIAPGGYLVLARSPVDIRQAYGPEVPCVGHVDFQLGNDGETVRLLLPDGRLADQVTFADRRPWAVEADGLDATLERISVHGDITDFTNFAASVPGSPPGSPGKANSRSGLIPARHDVILNEILYNPVKNPGADPLRHCPSEEFLELFNRGTSPVDISRWSFEGIDFTFPDGMTIAPGAYLVLYHDRAAFEAKYGLLPNATGPYGKELDDGGEELLLTEADGTPVDYVDYNDSIPWPINPDGLRGSLELADPWSDNERGRAWSESEDFQGTPGSKNSATLEFERMGGNAGPQITQVEARPAADPLREEIHSSDEVRIDARVLDRDGVASARLEYQAMAAGDYIRRTDARFQTDWTPVEMAYDADRALFTARIPALSHRTLVRYRIVARDGAGSPLEARSPRTGDPEPNHAYFVYDGVPDYTANHRSAFGPAGHVHTGLDRVPVYHVIAAEADIEEALYRRFNENDNTYRWLVTFVHGTQVHDHCGFRLRSGHRYSWPKRPFALRFNRGNRFAGVFNDGTPYPRKRRRMNLMTAQHDPGKPRGEAGVFESLGWKLFREAGVMGATTTIVHLRMVRSAEEHDQFLGDFFGTYLEIQEIDSTALEDLGRPLDDPSSLYKFEGGPVKVHPDCDASMADVRAFTSGYAQARPREWFEANLDVPRYLSFRSIVELTDNHDMDSLKNFFYYFNGDSLRWEVLPWDIDNTFGADSSGDEPLRSRVLPLFPIEYKNRFRFLWQVHYDENRLHRIIDEWRGWLRELADADLDRWDTEPREACPAWPQVAGGNCKQYQPFETRMRNLKVWIRNQTRMVTLYFRDTSIPATPSNLSPLPGWPAATPVTLRSSAFSDPDPADTHAASRWLVIERGGDWAFPSWEAESPSSLLEATLPAELTTPGRELAYRVAHQDSTGRWGFLSDPTSFVAGFPDTTPPTPAGGVSLEHASARVVALRWEPSLDLESGVFGYVVRRDGEPLAGTPVRGLRFADFAPVVGRKHAYEVIAVNGAGLESPPSSGLDVEVSELRALGGWRLPAGGVDYLYDALPGQDAYNASVAEDAFNLDGTWIRSRIDDWNGGRPAGAEDTPGGIEVAVARGPGGNDAPASVLSLEDPGNLSATLPTPNNQRLYLLRPAGDASLLADGVTLVARLRVNPRPLDLPGAKGQAPEPEAPRGQIGIAHRDAGSQRNFSLWLDGDRLGIPGGHSVGVIMTEFVSIWVTIQGEGGMHRVRVFLDGAAIPSIDELVDLPTSGTETGFSGSYLQMGLANRTDSGAIQVDYFGFKAGVHLPVADTGEGGRLFRRGDTSGDGLLGLDDALSILRYLFTGDEEIPCADSADTDDSGRLDISDPVMILRRIFFQGLPPPAPFPDCGPDGIEDLLPPCAGEGCEG